MRPEEDKALIAFLLAAIADAQGVIRSIDAKITALFVGLAIPLTKLTQIWEVCRKLIGFHAPNCLSESVVFLFAASWLVSIWAAIRTLWRVQNPKEYVDGGPAGTFFAGHLFKISPLESLLDGPVTQPANFDMFFASLPTTLEGVRRELAFEHMKLAFIRSVKLERSNIAYASFVTWLISGGIIWVAVLSNQ